MWCHVREYASLVYTMEVRNKFCGEGWLLLTTPLTCDIAVNSPLANKSPACDWGNERHGWQALRWW